tara:strand:+ start:12328 stop:12441 length:114 start_codon:yes stop_codon:yes gene_type:complete
MQLMGVELLDARWALPRVPLATKLRIPSAKGREIDRE